MARPYNFRWVTCAILERLADTSRSPGPPRSSRFALAPAGGRPRPCCAARAGFCSNSRSARGNSSATFACDTTRPVSPCAMASATPQPSAPTTAVPAAPASTSTKPNPSNHSPSFMAGKAKTSAAANQARIRSSLTNPKNLHIVAQPQFINAPLDLRAVGAAPLRVPHD